MAFRMMAFVYQQKNKKKCHCVLFPEKSGKLLHQQDKDGKMV